MASRTQLTEAAPSGQGPSQSQQRPSSSSRPTSTQAQGAPAPINQRFGTSSRKTSCSDLDSIKPASVVPGLSSQNQKNQPPSASSSSKDKDSGKVRQQDVRDHQELAVRRVREEFKNRILHLSDLIKWPVPVLSRYDRVDNVCTTANKIPIIKKATEAESQLQLQGKVNSSKPPRKRRHSEIEYSSDGSETEWSGASYKHVSSERSDVEITMIDFKSNVRTKITLKVDQNDCPFRMQSVIDELVDFAARSHSQEQDQTFLLTAGTFMSRAGIIYGQQVIYLHNQVLQLGSFVVGTKKAKTGNSEETNKKPTSTIVQTKPAHSDSTEEDEVVELAEQSLPQSPRGNSPQDVPIEELPIASTLQNLESECTDEPIVEEKKSTDPTESNTATATDHVDIIATNLIANTATDEVLQEPMEIESNNVLIERGGNHLEDEACTPTKSVSQDATNNYNHTITSTPYVRRGCRHRIQTIRHIDWGSDISEDGDCDHQIVFKQLPKRKDLNTSRRLASLPALLPFYDAAEPTMPFRDSELPNIFSEYIGFPPPDQNLTIAPEALELEPEDSEVVLPENAGQNFLRLCNDVFTEAVVDPSVVVPKGFNTSLADVETCSIFNFKLEDVTNMHAAVRQLHFLLISKDLKPVQMVKTFENVVNTIYDSPLQCLQVHSTCDVNEVISGSSSAPVVSTNTGENISGIEGREKSMADLKKMLSSACEPIVRKHFNNSLMRENTEEYLRRVVTFTCNMNKILEVDEQRNEFTLTKYEQDILDMDTQEPDLPDSGFVSSFDSSDIVAEKRSRMIPLKDIFYNTNTLDSREIARYFVAITGLLSSGNIGMQYEEFSSAESANATKNHFRKDVSSHETKIANSRCADIDQDKVHVRVLSSISRTETFRQLENGICPKNLNKNNYVPTKPTFEVVESAPYKGNLFKVKRARKV